MASFTAMASVKIPIYHWGEGRGKIKAMKAEREMSRLKEEEDLMNDALECTGSIILRLSYKLC